MSSTAKWSWPAHIAFTGAHLVPATALLCAGLLKAEGQKNLAGPIVSDYASWSVAVLIQFELFLGVWLLTGSYYRLARRVGIGTFIVFAVVAAMKVIAGSESCGCFGEVHVRPWVALSVDLCATCALLMLRPRFVEDFRRYGVAGRFLGDKSRAYVGLIGYLAIACVVIATPHPAGDSVSGAAAKQLTVLEPSTWVGNRLPIMAQITPHEKLDAGHWTLIFFRHDCADCETALPEYARILGSDGRLPDGSRLALVELPPYGPKLSWQTEARLARLNGEEWFLRTPLEVCLQNGIVRSASNDLPGLQRMRLVLAREGADPRSDYSPESANIRR
jgi:hypothetical protein